MVSSRSNGFLNDSIQLKITHSCFPVSNVASFRLPDPAGRAGGALTSCLLNVTYADHSDTGKDLSFKEVLMQVREKLQEKGYKQIPQLSSSRPTNLDHEFDIVPEGFTGTRRAVMIGINYCGQNPGELSGCHNDVLNVSYCVTCDWILFQP